MENSESPKPITGPVEITDDDLVHFLMFFAALWFRTNHYLKAIRALLAAACLLLRSFWKGSSQVQLQPKDLAQSIRDPLDLVVVAREVFAGMTFFEVHPFVRQVIKEMEAEANTLLSYYLLTIHPKEEPCG